MSTLVENNMANKHMGLKLLLLKKMSLYKVTLIKLPNLQIRHEGKTNTLTESSTISVYSL